MRRLQRTQLRKKERDLNGLKNRRSETGRKKKKGFLRGEERTIKRKERVRQEGGHW